VSSKTAFDRRPATYAEKDKGPACLPAPSDARLMCRTNGFSHRSQDARRENGSQMIAIAQFDSFDGAIDWNVESRGRHYPPFIVSLTRRNFVRSAKLLLDLSVSARAVLSLTGRGDND